MPNENFATPASPPGVCVFCGSRSGNDPAFALASRELGRGLALHGWRLVYGGGNIGLMGLIADSVLENGGQVTGVIPEALIGRELAHLKVSDMRVVPSMHARKALMAELSQAFIALPGGLGTLEELCEVLTWSQLRFHNKPAYVLNVAGYFDPLLRQLDQAVTSGFMDRESFNLLRVHDSVPALLAACESALRQPQDTSADLAGKI